MVDISHRNTELVQRMSVGRHALRNAFWTARKSKLCGLKAHGRALAHSGHEVFQMFGLKSRPLIVSRLAKDLGAIYQAFPLRFELYIIPAGRDLDSWATWNSDSLYH